MDIFERIISNRGCCLHCGTGKLNQIVKVLLEVEIVAYICEDCGAIHTKNSYKGWSTPQFMNKKVEWKV